MTVPVATPGHCEKCKVHVIFFVDDEGKVLQTIDHTSYEGGDYSAGKHTRHVCKEKEG